MRYAEIILPLAVRPLTYGTGGLDLCEGMAVVVGLGPRKLCQGIVWRLHDDPPGFNVRPVGRILYGRPLLAAAQMRFWEWVSEYYMCTLGEVMAAAIPAQLRPEGFSHEEFARDEFRPATVRRIGLHPSLRGDMDARMDTLRRARRQYEAMMELVGMLDPGDLFAGRIPRRQLSADSAILHKLAGKELIITEDIPAGEEAAATDFALPALTPAQAGALGSIRRQAGEKQAVLLHGVAGSGKTEIFVNLAASELQAGRNVLYLLPEIPVSMQLMERLERVFGDRLVAYHSKLTPRRRAAIFMQATGGGAKIYIGTRTAVFLPLRNLGLVIVDEEHDTTFKQDSPAPRFHARDCALMLSSLHGAHTVLGSATPSLESWYNATTGKYGLVPLTERYGGVPMPHVMLSDTLRAAKRGERDAHFNKLFLDKLAGTLSAGGQAIVFQNRRGFSPYVECGSCAWTARCPDCNVTLTLHKSDNRLRCHYCGYHTTPPRLCPSCKQGELLPRGYGTEKVGEELARIFPEAHIARLDSDTTASPAATRRIIEAFERGRTDILVGTQMVTKGFDFAGVRLVGAVNADNLLNYPDFRASERAFQMLTQAAGRAGRRDDQGEVVVQSTQPQHPVLQQVAAGDYAAMARTQLAERRAFTYPPYCRLISVTLKHKDKPLVDAAAASLASALRPVFGSRVLGPEPPAVDRVQNEHILVIMLKIERGKSFARAKTLLAGHLDALRNDPAYKKITLTVNVDPQ